MAEKITMTVKINRNRESEEISKKADGSEVTVSRTATECIFEQTVSELDVADVVAVVNKLIKQPEALKINAQAQ